MNIRLFKPCLGQEEIEQIQDAFERAWIGLGPKVREFEVRWSKYIGCNASLGLNSATAALHLALRAFDFPEGRKVLVPAITFSATAFAPVYNRLEPVFVDVDPETASMCLHDLERKYTPDCVAVIPVHMGGHPAQMDRILDFAQSTNLKVIEDCAHVAGASFKGRKLGTWGDIGCFSFEEKKAMTTGDGGMLCSDDTGLVDRMRPVRWVGIDKDTWRRAAGYTETDSVDARHWYYEIAGLGFKYNMNDLAASIGLAQLEKLDWMNQRRSECVARYMQGIESLEHIKPMLPFDPENNSYWLFGVRCDRRDDLIIHLKSRGIATSVHYIPLMEFPFFKQWASPCPVASEIWQTFITLPLFAELTTEEIDYVIAALAEFDRCW